MRLLQIQPTQAVGGFAKIRSRLHDMAPAKSMQEIAQAGSPAPNSPSATNDSSQAARVADIQNIDRPSTQFRSFEQSRRFFTMDYPKNWSAYEPVTGSGVTMAPDGGFVNTGGAARDLIYGVIVNHYDPFNEDADERFGNPSGFSQGFLAAESLGSGDRTHLARATNDLLSEILRANPNLKMVPDSQRNDRIDGAAALSLVLSGRSPITREEERVTLFTRELPDDHVIYALFIAPAKDYDELRPTFDRMVSSLHVNDEAAHR